MGCIFSANKIFLETREREKLGVCGGGVGGGRGAGLDRENR